MNHPHQSDRTRATSGPPVFNPGLSARDLPTTQKNETNPISAPTDEILRAKCYMLNTAFNETNPIYRIPSVPPPPNMQNEPNLPLPQPGPRSNICKTNPISAYRWRLAGFPSPKKSKRTQFATRGGPVEDQKMQNKPNPPYGHGPGAPGCPKYAKQTLFAAKMQNEPNYHVPLASRRPPRGHLCETNPIYQTIYNIQSTICSIQPLPPQRPSSQRRRHKGHAMSAFPP